ncbi:MAG: hypothetical protein HONBIEJF_01663 [Fimbriimonadaceae bacterium]|nr:hypothetical protein [Fimbriimonadaceae bacterium]
MLCLKKHWSIFVIYLKECFAYPAATMIWVVADVQAALILPAVWLASMGPSGQIAGFDGKEIVTYYLVTSALSQFIVCHLLWDIAWDIREGVFSSFIVRPFSFFRQSVSRNMSWRVTKAVLYFPVLFIVAWAYGGIRVQDLNFSFAFFLSIILAHTLSFLCAYCMSLVTLWTTEFFSIFRLYYFPEAFLSGRMLPLDTLPAWARGIADWMPFKYTIAFPMDVLMDRITPQGLQQGLGIQLAWCVGLYFLGDLLLHRGMRHYSGAGM